MIDYKLIYKVLLFTDIIFLGISFFLMLWAMKKYPPKKIYKKYNTKTKYLANLPFVPIPANISKEDRQRFFSYRKRVKVVGLVVFITLLIHMLTIFVFKLWVVSS